MAKLRRTLLIGLGGTGITAILKAKKMFYENYGQIPPMIGFIGIDTDGPSLKIVKEEANDGKNITLNTSEQLPISVVSPTLVYSQHKSSGMFDWIPEGNVNSLSALSIGAGQIRSNGRFAITYNENNVQQFINNKIAEINNAAIIDNSDYELLSSETEVHLVFSLGGGTGCGTFLNIAYLIKKMFPNIKLSGYGVLADVFRTKIPGPMSARVKTNAKGAIADLDFLAHLNQDSTPVELKWAGHTDRINYKPFDALYFIDNSNGNNDTFTEVNPLCDLIALAIVTSVGELGVALDSVSDNVSKLISDGAMDLGGKKAWVAGFGCAEIVFDGSRLAKIYAQKAVVQLINKMLNGGCDDPSTIANQWFDQNQIRENLGKDDVIDYFMPAQPQYRFEDIDDPSNPNPECQQYLANRATVPAATLNEKLSALEARIDESLSNLTKGLADRECGIYLCEQTLLSILHQINLCDGEMEQEGKELENSLPSIEGAYKTAVSELEHCMGTFLKSNRKDLEDEVKNQTMRLAVARREITRRQMARQFYNWLTVRVNQSLARVNIITQNLHNVRNECNNEIEKILRAFNSANFFQFDLAADLASTIECPISDIVYNDFAKEMQPEGGVAALAGMTSKQTEETLLRFARKLPGVTALANKTVDDVLNAMPEDQFKNLINRAIQKSLPLIPHSHGGFILNDQNRPAECYYVAISNKGRSRLAKNDFLKSILPNAMDVQFSEVGLKNRIIIYRQIGVLPAFTLKALNSYESEYRLWEERIPAGSHWDKNLYDRMVKERYSLNPKDEVSESKLLETWINAIIFDLIKYDAASGMYKIKSRGLGGRPLRGWMVDMGASRADAFRFLEDNMDILANEIKNEIKNLDVPGPDNQIRILSEKAFAACNNNTYLEEVSKCPYTMETIEHYPDEMDLIEKEMTYILDNMA